MATAVSLIICSRDRTALLADCVASARACRPAPAEILIVDQGRDAAAVAALDGRPGGPVRVIRMAPEGLAAGRNRGRALARAPLVTYVDDDCLLTAGYIGAIARAFDADPSLGGVFGRLLPLFERSAGMVVGVQDQPLPLRYTRPVNPGRLGHGASMAFRRELLEACGGFDERLGPGGPWRNADEVDLAYRALKAGWPLAYDPSIVSYHRQWRDRRTLLKVERDYAVGAGAFFGKHLRAGDVRVLAVALDRLLLSLRQGLRHARAGHARPDLARLLHKAVAEFLLPPWGVLRAVLAPRLRRPRRGPSDQAEPSPPHR